MPFQVSRSAWSVIGWVTISHPKINSEISKILAPNFRDFQKIKKVPGIPTFPKFPKMSNLLNKYYQNFHKVRPYVLEKSRPLGLGILEILEILDFLGNFKFSKKFALSFGKIPSTRSGILEFLEILDILEISDFLVILEFSDLRPIR